MMSEEQQQQSTTYLTQMREAMQEQISRGAIPDFEAYGVALLHYGCELQTHAGCTDEEIATVLFGLGDLHAERAGVNGELGDDDSVDHV